MAKKAYVWDGEDWLTLSSGVLVLDDYLKLSTASSLYLPISASSNFLFSNTASATYLRQDSASSIYLGINATAVSALSASTVDWAGVINKPDEGLNPFLLAGM